MKILIIVLSVFLAVSTGASAQNSTKPSKEETQKTIYTCPKHPNEVSIKEGKCSKCGTELVKTTKIQHNAAVKGSQASTVVEAKYICKMDGSTSDKPGKCTKCGKEMSKNEAYKMAYACPMHPDQMSMKEGKCGKCGIKMVKITELKHNTAVKGSQTSAIVETKYVCPMHPDFIGKKGDKCSKCGMEMIEIKEKR
ncbi:heavy metal-binding domain-containing protein [Flavobacterium soyangense]|uniref:Heavy metal binding domain-containing protein n=1 Tax=Flavobacterium soyangense TaxID=2023265 RepID=A0A930UE35_9FLAO|nr:heavy metal-binding domain-containing protein [Flavobacterium soyangense]MBF2709064.1 hypothetical protein [Flavobacterium soyangense]